MTATPSELTRRVIGALASDPRRPACIRVMVQGRPLLTISREIAAAEGLAVGTALEEPLYARLCRAADEEAAYRTALRLLEHRPFAARDLARRLVLKGHSPEATAAALQRAHAAGLVDDARFTLHYVETRAARGRGPLRLRRDLAALGVERTLVDRALLDAFPEGSAGIAEVVEPLARKRLAQLRGVPRAAARRRLQSFLARRGFQGDAVHALVLRLLGGS
jgi:regulatory protein